MEIMRYNGGAVSVRVIPGDGHCLFAALVHQYHRMEINSKEHRDATLDIRKRIENHIRENLERYAPSLTYAAGLDYGDANQGLSDFLSRLGNGKEWGGEESITAMTEIYNCRIDVYCEQGARISFNESGAANRTLRVAYRIGGRTSKSVERSHYDSVVQLLRNDATAEILSTNGAEENRNIGTGTLQQLLEK
ncbi:uncharacterized protein LOC129719926 [Wyeomyia smithii]|uniref:uncharacterized protein LOC129719926 n=1 Tax=Wyeomyia smithii TaxID=174621 RepID=UPI002467BC52|nr:uncharacterized protein LOC129719926 [Wyeomyia smithii]